MIKSISLSNITAGFVAVMVGFTSTVAIILQAAGAAGATPIEIGSWLLALGVGMATTCIGLSLYYRIPILTAWSTPGAALLVTGLSGVSMQEAIGAFIFSALLVILSGVTGIFEKAMLYIPRSLASAMLAGILFHFGTSIFTSMQQQFALVLVMFIVYLVGKIFFPRFVILMILLSGGLVASSLGLLPLRDVHVTLSIPIYTMPIFSMPVLISVGIPLFIVTMTSQNIPGIAVIRAAGYKPRVSSLISWTGVVNLIIAPFGGFALNLAALTAAICASEEADHNPDNRYKAAVCAGFFYLLAGLFGATIVTLFTALPKELVLATAGLALLGTMGNSLKTALEDDQYRESALITLLVTASGMSMLGIGSAFWGLSAGILSTLLLKCLKNLSTSSLSKKILSGK